MTATRRLAAILAADEETPGLTLGSILSAGQTCSQARTEDTYILAVMPDLSPRAALIVSDERPRCP